MMQLFNGIIFLLLIKSREFSCPLFCFYASFNLK